MSQHNSSLEARIAGRFEALRDRADFPTTAPDDDFELKALLAFLQPVAGLRVLDVGCGKGRFARALARHGAKVVGLDRTPAFAHEAASHGGHYVVGSATVLPFPDGVFDAAIAVESFQHLPDPESGIQELTRVVRPGGKIQVIDKQWLSLAYWPPIPWLLLKPLLEVTGGWMYPREFGFRERWFMPWTVSRLLQRHGCRVSARHIGPRTRLRLLFERLPFLNVYMAWNAETPADVRAQALRGSHQSLRSLASGEEGV